MLWDSTWYTVLPLYSLLIFFHVKVFLPNGVLFEHLILVVSDCEWKAQAGNVCVASFDWSCSGICKSVERIKDVHARCGEGDGAIWSTPF